MRMFCLAESPAPQPELVVGFPLKRRGGLQLGPARPARPELGRLVALLHRDPVLAGRPEPRRLSQSRIYCTQTNQLCLLVYLEVVGAGRTPNLGLPLLAPHLGLGGHHQEARPSHPVLRSCSYGCVLTLSYLPHYSHMTKFGIVVSGDS